MKNLESKLQRECIRWFDYSYPDFRLNLFAIPNGGKRNIITASIMKAEGVRAGVADLFLAVAKSGSNGLFIEMKYGKNKQSDNQLEFQKCVFNQGYSYVVCYSFDEFKEVIEKYKL